MTVTPEDIAYAKGLFEGLGPVTTRRMMGGACLYSDGVIFAILHSDLGLMIKAQGDFIQHMEDIGQTQWVYTRKSGAKGAMPYWSMPEDALDDPERACDLARQALTYLE